MVGFGPTTSGEKKKAKNSKDKKLEITYHESQDNFFEEPQPIILDMPDRSAETTVPVDITSSIELGVNEETLISGEETKRNNIFLQKSHPLRYLRSCSSRSLLRCQIRKMSRYTGF